MSAITAEAFRANRLRFEPIQDSVAQALLAGDTSGVNAAEGWPHTNTLLGLRMATSSGQPFWLVLLDGAVVGDCGTLGPPDAEGEVEIGCGLSPAYAGYRGQLVRALTAWLLSRPGVSRVVGESPDAAPADEPLVSLTDPRTLLAEYLDYYRKAVLRKLDGMSEQALRESRLPSGWTPLGLLRHLTYMERRWFCWGFLAEPVAEPWGGGPPGSDWQAPATTSTAELIAAFRSQAARSREIVAAAELPTVSNVGGRFSEFGDRPTLIWILFHVLQEYARHAGHLDVARELADGALGE
jgi:hypothetical protein